MVSNVIYFTKVNGCQNIAFKSEKLHSTILFAFYFNLNTLFHKLENRVYID